MLGAMKTSFNCLQSKRAQKEKNQIDKEKTFQDEEESSPTLLSRIRAAFLPWSEPEIKCFSPAEAGSRQLAADELALTRSHASASVGFSRSTSDESLNTKYESDVEEEESKDTWCHHQPTVKEEIMLCQWFLLKRFSVEAAHSFVDESESLGGKSLRAAVLHRNFINTHSELLWPSEYQSAYLTFNPRSVVSPKQKQELEAVKDYQEEQIEENSINVGEIEIENEESFENVEI